MNSVVVRSFRRSFTLALVTLGMVLAVARTAEATSIVQVQGSTLGCFGTACSTFTSPASSPSSFALTFTGASFDVATNASGTVANIALGTLARANVNVSSGLGTLNFTLQVTFSLPLGLGSNSGQFSAVVQGTNSGGGGAESINFDNTPILFTYSNASGNGSFNFAVSTDLSLAKATSGSILGVITNATFTPAAPQEPVATPEPSTLVLLGLGLTVAARRLRRRRS